MTAVVAPSRHVTIALAAAVTGYTVQAIENKIQRGVWIQGREWKRAPDGRILIDLKGYERWAEGQSQAESEKKRGRSDSTSASAGNG